jgi:hypothetical protein
MASFVNDNVYHKCTSSNLSENVCKKMDVFGKNDNKMETINRISLLPLPKVLPQDRLPSKIPNLIFG